MSESSTPEYCPRCGASVPGDTKYCGECGEDLLAYSPDDGGPASAAPPQPADGGQDDSPLVTRRRLLVGGGAVLFGGAAIVGIGALSESEHRVHDGWDVERSTGLDSMTLEGTVTIPPGQYAARIFEPETTVEYTTEFEVTDGKAIDVLFLDDGEYDRYRDRDDDVQIRGKRMNARAGDFEVTVGSGEFHLVFDNSAVYGASPSGEATVSLTITATPA
ncbi:MAG: zinc-ribbon domain-containing protein [archaeon]